MKKYGVSIYLALGVFLWGGTGCDSDNAGKDPVSEQVIERAESGEASVAEVQSESVFDVVDVPKDVVKEKNTGSEVSDVEAIVERTETVAIEPVLEKKLEVFGAEGALSESQRKLLGDIVWDMPPEVLNAIKAENEGKHFLRSDEKHPEKFQKTIENLGHVYIGIGTDQQYVFVGWQRPSLAFMVDYDPWVIVLHRIYMAVFTACENSDCMLEYFRNKNAGLAFLKGIKGLDDKLSLKVYKEAHHSVTFALRSLRHLDERNFMNDPEIYEYIRRMIAEGRLLTFQANLLGDRAFSSIAETLKVLGETVGVLYLSNAEQYWAYSRQFRENMLGLPYAENAVVLRTLALKPQNGDYRYSVQNAGVFRQWLEHPKTKSVRTIVGHTRIEDENEIPFTIDNHLPK